MSENDLSKCFVLELGTNIIHVHSWNTHAFDSNCFSKFPMIMNIIQHIVSQTIPPNIDVPFSFASLTLRNKCFPLFTGKRFSLNHLSLLLPLLFQIRVLCTLQALHRGVHRGGTHSGPFPLHPARPKGRVLGLPQANGPHLGVALRVAEPEVKGQVVGASRLAAHTVEGGGGPVLGLGLFLVGLGGRGSGALGFGSEGRRGFESVGGVEFGRGGREVAREERRGG